MWESWVRRRTAGHHSDSTPPGLFRHCPHPKGPRSPPSSGRFYLPLSERIWGTNSLYLESEPGMEDWHALTLA